MRAEVAKGLAVLLVATAPAWADDVESVVADEFDFFDYLGEMVEEEGEWLDPLAMEADLQLDGAQETVVDVQDAVTNVVSQDEDDE